MSRYLEAGAYAARQLQAAHGDLSALSLPLLTVVLVTAAQGTIDNGGLGFFFGPDFPGRPHYSMFIEAYRRIGAARQADRLEAAVRLFPFADPHLARIERRAFMDQHLGEFEALDDGILDSLEVRVLLERYVECHAQEFPLDAGIAAKPTIRQLP